ncbi:MAG: HflC protein [Rhodospirillaceae bacterium]|nr:HflC protein [Rhodospirillaceae bacterium]|tara:strand:- start:30839 stop:31723 length:885 start_codon:yes stop_codon:yes gene_type:complete
MGNLKLVIGGIVVLVFGIALFDSMFVVHQTKSALVLQFGKPVLPVHKEPGLKFKIPVVQDVEYFDNRILDLDPAPQEVILQDQKRINVDSFVRYKIVNPLEFKRRALTQANFIQIFGGRLNAAVRAEVGKVLLGDMLSDKRDDVMERITAALKKQAPQFGIEVVDVRIGRTDLPAATAQSVYKRMNSEREAQARKLRSEGAEAKVKIQADADRQRTIILANARREAQILRGEGEGAKTKILNDAFGQDPEFFGFYRSMEAYGSALGDGTTMVLSPDSEFFRYFRNLGGKNPAEK